METWYRVFGKSDQEPDIEAMGSAFAAKGLRSKLVRSDDLGWIRADCELISGQGSRSFVLERFLATEEDIRASLNTWAAYIEATGTDSDWLMERVVTSKQLLVMKMDFDSDQWSAPVELCRWLASATDGVYQVDGQGFFAADGKLLLPE